MRYQDYSKKIKKLRTLRNGLFHMRYVFLGLAIGGVISGASVMACTGIVSEAQAAKSTYTYGEPIDLKGDAFLSDVVYEFRARGSDEWSTVKPKNAGNYEYRYYTKNTFGSNRYSEPVAFEIAKKVVDFPITSDRIVYGEDPAVKFPVLNGTDKIKTFSFKYDSFTSFNTNVAVDKASIKVMDGEVDVSENYDFNCIPHPITFEKRFIKFHFQSSEGPFIYDNQAHTFEGYTSDENFAFEDHVELGPGIEITDVGKIKNMRDVVIKNKDGIDVTHLYKINKTADDLVVNAREITVKSADIERDYDGKIAEQRWEIVSETQLVPGHHLVVEFDNDKAWEVGKQDSTFKCYVADDVTNEPIKEGSYKINKVYGNINIKPRHLSVSTDSVYAYYDGSTIKSERLYTSGLADGDVAVVTSKPVEQTEVGKVVNKLEYVIKRGDINVTHCYDIKNNEEWGELEVAKRPIVVDLNVIERKTYDGKPIVVDSDNFTVLTHDQDPASQGLAPNHRAVPDVSFKKSFVEVGSYDCSEFGVKIYPIDPATGKLLQDREHEVTDKYEIKYKGKDSVITIDPIHISIKTPDINETYTGSEIKNHEIEILEGGLLLGDKFETYQDQPYVDANEKTQANILGIVIKNEKNEDVTSNYVFDNIVYGEVNINKAPVTVSPRDATKVYDDKAYNESSVELDIKDAEGRDLSHKLTAIGNVKSDQIDANVDGQPADITFADSNIVITDKQGNNVTKNFIITKDPNPAKLTINKVGLQISVEGKRVAYEENPNLTLKKEDAHFEGLISTNYVSDVTFSGEIPLPDELNGGSKTVGVESYVIKSETRNQAVVTDNYFELGDRINGSFTSFYSTPVTITSSDVVRKYNGQKVELTAAERELKATGLAKGHKIVAEDFTLDNSYNGTYINVKDTVDLDSEGNIISYNVYNNANYHIENAEGKIVTNCYPNITFKPGKVTILPLELEVWCRDKVYYYDESERVYQVDPTNSYGYNVTKNYKSPVQIINGSLPKGEQLYMNGFGARGTDPDTYDPFEGATFTVRKTSGEIVDQSNYKIRKAYNSGSLQIKQINITVSTLDYTGDFDTSVGYGNPQFKNSYSYSDSLLPGHRIQVSFHHTFTQRTNGIVQNTANITIYDSNGYDVTRFYNIITDWGRVNIR